jgi:competence protein ComEC
MIVKVFWLAQKRERGRISEGSRRIFFILILGIVLSFGSWGYAQHHDQNTMNSIAMPDEQQLLLYLKEPMQQKVRDSYGGSIIYYQGVFRTEGLDSDFKVLLRMPEDFDLGQVIVVKRKLLSIPDVSGGTGQMDFRSYCFSKGILLQGNLSRGDYERMSSRKSNIGIRIAEHKLRFYQKLNLVLGEDAALVEGMVFGDTEGIAEEDLQLITSLGLRHLFAVSGFHVGIYFCLLLLLCALIGCRGWTRVGILMLGLVYFCLLTGSSASTLRACLVLVVYLLLENLQWEKRFPTSLAIAGLVLLIWNPYIIFSLGYKLSFAAAYGLAYLYPFFRKVWGVKVLGVGMGAWLASLPFQSVFCGVSWVGILLTPIFSLFLGLFLPSTLCAYLLDFCLISDLILAGSKPVLKLLLFLLHFFDRSETLAWLLDKTILHFPVTSYPRMFFYYFCLILLVWLGSHMIEEVGRKESLYTGLIVLLLVSFLALPVPSKGLEIVFINVGQGDSTLVRYKGFNMLVDTGTEQAGRYAVVPYLRSKKIEVIDLLVLTHPDHDHIGGAMEVLESVRVDGVAFSQASREELGVEEQELMKLIQLKGIPFAYHSKGESWRFEDLFIEVQSPDLESSSRGIDSNEGSLVLGVKLQDLYLQLTGDVDQSMLKNLLSPVKEGIYLFKIPHHGSKNSLNVEINDRLNVDLVTVSCGKNNRYGHPHQVVLDYWQKRGVPIYRTDEMGELFFRYSHNVLSLEN